MLPLVLLVWGLVGGVVAGEQQVLSTGEKASWHLSVVDQYFHQSDDSTNDTAFDPLASGLGLKPGYEWSQVIDELEAYNERNSSVQYKLVYLQRHGEGFHNIVPPDYTDAEWQCFWKTQNGNGSVEWYDAELTDAGQIQIVNMTRAWIGANVPYPESYYVSPMRRTLQTWRLLWGAAPIKVRPTVIEVARETYGISTSSKRHSREYIERHFGFVEFEPGFSQFDPWWQPDVHESRDHRQLRAQQMLEAIFGGDRSVTVLVVSHSGLIKSVLELIGHRRWDLHTGQMVPVVIRGEYKHGHHDIDTSQPWEKYRLCR